MKRDDGYLESFVLLHNLWMQL